jgi:hypothetical protein
MQTSAGAAGEGENATALCKFWANAKCSKVLTDHPLFIYLFLYFCIYLFIYYYIKYTPQGRRLSLPACIPRRGRAAALGGAAATQGGAEAAAARPSRPVRRQAPSLHSRARVRARARLQLIIVIVVIFIFFFIIIFSSSSVGSASGW